jgi:hypothetical protein
VTVRVARVDLETSKIDFVLAPEETAATDQHEGSRPQKSKPRR